MASIVLIKEAAESVAVNAEGHATHVFTVTNEASRRQPVGLQVLTDSPADSGWFHIDGMPERELDAGASYQIKVELQVPAGTPEGRYTFRLLVYSAVKGRADEDFTEGPTVGVSVPAAEATPEPEPAPTKKFPWWIVAVAAGVLLVAGIAAFFVFGDTKGGNQFVGSFNGGYNSTPASTQIQNTGYDFIFKDDSSLSLSAGGGATGNYSAAGDTITADYTYTTGSAGQFSIKGTLKNEGGKTYIDGNWYRGHGASGNPSGYFRIDRVTAN